MRLKRKRKVEKKRIETYLQHDWLFGGPRSCEVLHVPTALVVECGPTGHVFPIPLDDVVAVEEILL